MAQLIQVIKKFDDGTETIHDFVPNPNAAEIEAKVREAQHEGVEVSASEPVALVDEETLSSTEDVVEKPKRKKKEVVEEEAKDEE